MNAQGGGGGGGLEEFLPQIFVWVAYYVSCQKRLCKIKYGFEGSISNAGRGPRPGSTHQLPT